MEDRVSAKLQGGAFRMRRLAVVGSPIEHSLSPRLHLAVFASLGLDWEYQKREASIGSLREIVADLDALSVTMPLKDEAYEFANELDLVARETKVVNTLIARQGQWLGFNTDAPGIVTTIADHGVTSIGRAIVIGNGATARSAIAALRPIASSIAVMARSERFLDSVDEYLPWGNPLDADLVISTVPEGAADRLSSGKGLLIDLLYSPWPTPLARQWEGECISGLELLVNQAALQSRLFLEHLAAEPIFREVDNLRSIMRQALS